MASFDLGSLKDNPATAYTASYSFTDFVARYQAIIPFWGGELKLAVQAVFRNKRWKPEDCAIGESAVFLGEFAWIELEITIKGKGGTH